MDQGTIKGKRPGLYANLATGEVYCAAHGYFKGTDSDRGFRRVTPKLGAELGDFAKCEVCELTRAEAEAA